MIHVFHSSYCPASGEQLFGGDGQCIGQEIFDIDNADSFCGMVELVPIDVPGFPGAMEVRAFALSVGEIDDMLANDSIGG